MSSPIEEASARRAVSAQKAREQAAEYFGFAASVDIEINGEIFEIPNQSLLDDDQQERINDLTSEIERICDREDDIEIPEHTMDDGTVIPARTLRGEVKRPYTVNGEPLKPAYNTRVAIALFGQERYERFKAGGGRSNQIGLIWGRMNREFEERLKADPKSAAGVGDSAALLNGGSVGLVAVPSSPDS